MECLQSYNVVCWCQRSCAAAPVLPLAVRVDGVGGTAALVWRQLSWVVVQVVRSERRLFRGGDLANWATLPASDITRMRWVHRLARVRPPAISSFGRVQQHLATTDRGLTLRGDRVRSPGGRGLRAHRQQRPRPKIPTTAWLLGVVRRREHRALVSDAWAVGASGGEGGAAARAARRAAVRAAASRAVAAASMRAVRAAGAAGAGAWVTNQMHASMYDVPPSPSAMRSKLLNSVLRRGMRGKLLRLLGLGAPHPGR